MEIFFRRDIRFAFLTGFVLSMPGWCEDLPGIETDRPDQTETSHVIPKGFTQIEAGWTHESNRTSGGESVSDTLPETLLRYGLTECLELRLETFGHTWEEVHPGSGFPRERTEGWQDGAVGFKCNLWEEDPDLLLPEAALLAHLSVPVGAEGRSSQRSDPDFRFSFSNTLSEKVSLGYNLGAAWETAEDDRGDQDTLSVFQYTTTLGLEVTEKVGIFVEVFGDLPLSAEGGPAHSLDGGLTYLLSKNLQLDIASGVGLSEDAPDWFFGLGVSYRFPR